MKKRIIAAVMVAVVSLSGINTVYATTLSDAKSEKSSAQSSLDDLEDEIAELEEQQAALQEEIDALDSDLVAVLADISIIEDEIEEKEAELEQAQADLEEAQAQEAEQYEAMKERICYMYENGNSSILDVLAGAESFADLVNKIENFNTVYSYDRTLLVEYQNTKETVETLIETVEEEQAQLEENEAALEEQQASLEAIIAEKSSEMDDYESELAEAEALAEEYKETIEAANEIIEAQIEAAATTTTVTAGASSVGSSSSSDTSETSDTSDSSDTSSNSSSSTASGSGQAVANYAVQFVGNPYKYGGSSLTNGADCSGFVMAVYAHFGVSLPHSSSAMRSVGYAVSTSDMQPGDIICYSGHVAIYIGNGKIVHASTPSTGIKISSNVYYKTILAVRRIF